MKIVLLGNEIDTTKEREIFSITENGFKVTVTYKVDSWISKHRGEKAVDVFNNCTEVHHLYDTILKGDNRIAFESDVHQTGCTRSINDIEIVVVETASEKSFNF